MRKTMTIASNKVLYIFMILSILFFILSAAAPSEAVNSPLKGKVEVRLLNFRVGPSVSHTLIKGLPSGTPFEALFLEGDWMLVMLEDGSTGWACREFTSLSGQMSDKLPPVIAKKIVVEGSLLNVRLGPGLSYKKINELPRNTTATVYFERGEWLLVRLPDGASGWVSSLYTSYLDEDKKTTEKPEQQSPSEPVKEEPVKEEKEEQFPYNVSVTADPLRLREEPGLHNNPVGDIPKGTVLTVLDATEEQWLKVELPDGKQGWIAGWYTQRVEAQTGSPITYFRLATVNADVLRVRSGPGLEYSQTGRVFSGNHLITLQENNGWYYVQIPNGQYGWISGEFASVKTVASNVSASSGSPSRGGNLNTPNITIVIDPGHGGNDNGATGFSGLKEKKVNLTVSLYVTEMLRARGFNVVLTRNSDIKLTLAERVAMAERVKGDIFISIHANAHPNIFTSGTETFYYANKAASPQSFFLATLLQQETVGALKLPSLGVKKANFHVIRETTMPSALLELAFLTNAVDETMLSSDECLKMAAEAIYRAILRYYNLR
ncbi:MAG: N-acetylmuramoyl-L-alanine amidase [Bacillota bacterium]|nr:N-acetylmuramoyl-L-alanine amidase [Bacillota bacterium]